MNARASRGSSEEPLHTTAFSELVSKLRKVSGGRPAIRFSITGTAASDSMRCRSIRSRVRSASKRRGNTVVQPSDAASTICP